jgi:sensor c-di-GMP phosphodiesterase-like protein
MNRENTLLVALSVLISLSIVAVVYWISIRWLSPLAELERAVQKGKLMVQYQPIIALSSGVCVGAEALVRLRRNGGELVRPEQFIGLAEKSGVIRAITEQVIDRVISDLGEALKDDIALHVNINLSAEDICSAEALDILDRKLKAAQVQTQQIWLEATERGLINIDKARVTLRTARDRGYSVAIDDFGTGYSSLQYIQGLPIDALKIDKSFVGTIGKDVAASGVISYIIEMAKGLNFQVVAEGIETLEQLQYLKARNVEYGQGWLFSRPLAPSDFIAFRAARNAEVEATRKASSFVKMVRR